MIAGRSFFDQPIKNNLKTHDNIRKIATGQGDDYTTGCLLDYPYFKKYFKSNALDLSKQKKVDVDPKSIQQINATGNLNTAEDAIIFFIVEEVKETVSDFSKGRVKELSFYFVLIWY